MSFKALLNHKCDLYGLTTTDNDGTPITGYTKVNTNPIPCRLDLNFIRQGKDNMWLEAVARPEDRSGVMFFMPNAPIKSGLRAVMLRGPKGIFQLQGAIDEAWDFNSVSHYEAGVIEVSTLQWRGPVTGQG